MKIRTIIILAVLIAIIAAALIFFMNMKHKIDFTYVKITRGDIENTIESTGNLQYEFTNNVNALDAGTIVKIYSDFNKKVYKGQVMARIDDTLSRRPWTRQSQTFTAYNRRFPRPSRITTTPKRFLTRISRPSPTLKRPKTYSTAPERWSRWPGRNWKRHRSIIPTAIYMPL